MFEHMSVVLNCITLAIQPILNELVHNRYRKKTLFVIDVYGLCDGLYLMRTAFTVTFLCDVEIKVIFMNTVKPNDRL